MTALLHLLQTLGQQLADPWHSGFMVRGFLAGGIVGVLCGVIGCYVVLRGMAFLGDAMAHSILPGVAVAYMLGKNEEDRHTTIGALVAALLVALGLGFLTRRGAVKEDTAIGILFAGAFSLGIVLISTMRSYQTDLSHILIGYVLGVSWKDVVLLGSIAVAVLAAIVVFYKEFLVISFDPILAITLKLKTARLQMLMLILLALTIVVSLQTVGVALVAGMLVTPGAAAYLLARRLPAMMLIAGLIGAGSSFVGAYASWWFSVETGAAMVLTATLVFVLAFLFAPGRGLLHERLQARRERRT